MSRERFEKLFPVPEWAAFNGAGYVNPDRNELDPATNLVREAALDLVNSRFAAWQARQPEIDELVEALEMARFELVDYADDDAIASGHGSGCRSNPNESIRPTLERLDALIAKHKGEA